MTSFQLFDALDAATEAALRASIEEFGVLVPVVKDQHGNVLDGHHRSRLADELGVSYRVDIIVCEDDDHARRIAATLNTDRRHLDKDQRQAVVLRLASIRDAHGVQVHSPNAIADALGVSLDTIQRDVNELTDVGKLEPPTHVRGRDGKAYPAKKPTVVAAKNAKEAERAQQALSTASDVLPAGRVIDVKRAERISREHAADQRRAEPLEPATVHGLVDIRHGDLRDALDDIPDGSVDAIITDPPYPAPFWRPHSDFNVYEPLGELAQRILRPNGVLAVMIGTRLEMLDAVDQQLGRYMRRRWRAIYLTPGPRWRDNTERVATGYKPILIYSHPAATELKWINDDVFTSTGDDKGHHHWGQSETGIGSLVERLTAPGDIVVDPFVGGGTTAVVCRDLGRRFIGCDIDAAAVRTTRERVA